MEGGVGRGGWLEAAMHAWLCMTQSFRPIQEVYGFVKDTLLSKLDKVRNSVHQSSIKTYNQVFKRTLIQRRIEERGDNFYVLGQYGGVGTVPLLKHLPGTCKD